MTENEAKKSADVRNQDSGEFLWSECKGNCGLMNG